MSLNFDLFVNSCQTTFLMKMILYLALISIQIFYLVECGHPPPIPPTAAAPPPVTTTTTSTTTTPPPPPPVTTTTPTTTTTTTTTPSQVTTTTPTTTTTNTTPPPPVTPTTPTTTTSTTTPPPPVTTTTPTTTPTTTTPPPPVTTTTPTTTTTTTTPPPPVTPTTPTTTTTTTTPPPPVTTTTPTTTTTTTTPPPPPPVTTTTPTTTTTTTTPPPVTTTTPTTTTTTTTPPPPPPVTTTTPTTTTTTTTPPPVTTTTPTTTTTTTTPPPPVTITTLTTTTTTTTPPPPVTTTTLTTTTTTTTPPPPVTTTTPTTTTTTTSPPPVTTTTPTTTTTTTTPPPPVTTTTPTTTTTTTTPPPPVTSTTPTTTTTTTTPPPPVTTTTPTTTTTTTTPPPPVTTTTTTPPPPPCSYAPCLNGGKCTNIGLTDYTCSCPTRYTGENCTLECGEKLTDILFIIDSSGSVGLENFKKILSFVQSFALQFSIGPQSVQFSVITFFWGVSPQFNFNTYSTINEVIQAIQDLEYNANSDVYKALQYAHEESFKPANGARANSSKMAIVISDGVSEDRASTAREAALLHDIAEVFAFGIGPDVDYDELKKIASGRGISQVNSFDQLQTIQQQLTDAACPKDHCNHRHWPNTLPDVVFVLDSSRGQGDTYFWRQLDYVEKVVSCFDIGPRYFQFSVITYNFHATREISLGAHATLASLTDAIKNIGYTSGPSYTHLGLRMAREDISGSCNGRPGHVIVLSDGLSSNMVETEKEAKKLKTMVSKVSTVAIGPQILHTELLTIASSISQVYTSINTDLMHHIYRKYAPDCLACTKKYADVSILFEVSTDLTKPEFNTLLESLKFFLEITNINTTSVRISFTHFWSDVSELFTFDTYTDAKALIADVVTTAVQKKGQTNASKAFDHVIQAGFTGSNRKIMLLFSSARFTDIDDVMVKAQQLKDDGVYIATVGVGLNSNHSNLLNIASDPAFSYLIGPDVYIDKSSLQALLSTLEYDFCDGYID